MKNNHTTTKQMVGAARQRPKVRFDHSNMPQFKDPPRSNLIQWPSEQQILEVSKRLARINRIGIRWEASGDYFNSGDLAYQIQEIIRATDDLFKKSQRINSR
jgi:hypothetical protein